MNARPPRVAKRCGLVESRPQRETSNVQVSEDSDHAKA